MNLFLILLLYIFPQIQTQSLNYSPPWALANGRDTRFPRLDFRLFAEGENVLRTFSRKIQVELAESHEPDGRCNTPFQRGKRSRSFVQIAQGGNRSSIGFQEAIPDGPFSYPGINRREVLLVDPENSPILNEAFADLKNQLEKTFDEREILLTTFYFVREHLFDLDRCTEKIVAELIQQFTGQEPEISIEIFLEEKIGVCRHIALVTTYLLHRLNLEGWIEGKALLIREQIPSGRHAWSVFISESGAWHLDPYWGIFENGKTRAGFCHLCQKYGKRAMERYQ